MNDNRHAACDHAAKCICVCTDLVRMVENVKIAYGRSWKSPRMSWMRNGDDVGLNISKTSVRIYMPLIAG